VFLGQADMSLRSWVGSKTCLGRYFSPRTKLLLIQWNRNCSALENRVSLFAKVLGLSLSVIGIFVNPTLGHGQL
jgi:hypothetical protein